uniref:Uncharacterized protein LOC104249525 n=1 Tax=Nicotiana sylvestris TaxID=4096 RepID=A0A1U7YMC2_NICSY|nr:PREDICTED: uncharacterized protein LOC104249525 [Nicotiana sylvestris]
MVSPAPFAANLIWHFEWKPMDRDDVDLTEKFESTESSHQS